jgi:hypothetical protein
MVVYYRQALLGLANGGRKALKNKAVLGLVSATQNPCRILAVIRFDFLRVETV